MQASQLITSYSVPPQSSFSCPPCSIRLRSDGKSVPVRQTYCIIQRPEAQLQCFLEEGEKHGTSRVAASVFSINDTQSPAVFLETIPVNHDARAQSSCDVIVVHQNGTIRRIAGDLSAQRWSTMISDLHHEPTSNLEVRAAHWISQEQAKNSLLKNRPDLQISHDSGDSGFMVLIAKRTVVAAKRTEDMIYGIWSLAEQGVPKGLGNKAAHRTTPLVLQTLPDTETWRNNHATQYSFNSVNGALSVAFNRGLITYDLSTYAPRIASKLSVACADTSLPMPLTPSLAVGSTPSAVTLYDTKYGSIQSAVDLERIGSRRKRKRSGSTSRNSVRFIAYFAKIKRLLACLGHALVAFDIAYSDPQGSRNALPGDGMLIDAIGRGKPSENRKHIEAAGGPYLDFGIVRGPNDHNESWMSQKQRLDEFASKGDVTAFDELMAKELCASLDATEIIDDGTLQLPRRLLHVAQSKVDYLVSKVFALLSDIEPGVSESAETGNYLKIVMPTTKLIHWLILANQLTDQRVEKALQRIRSSQASAVRPGAVALALTRDQPSYEMITDYLKHSPSLPLSETLQAAKLLLADLVANATTDLPPASLQEGVTNHEMSFSEDAMPTDRGDDSKAIQAFAVSLKLPSDDTLTPNTASAALLNALQSLGSHSSQDVTTGLRSQLSQVEILSIVQVLRQQLFHSGHASYLPTPPSSATSSPKLGDAHAEGISLSLDCILRLLSSCLDAIGPVGFLAQSENDDFLEKMIPELKSEVSFAFEGMQETNHLQGLLREVIRYGDSAQGSNHGHVTKPQSQQLNLEGQQKPGTIVTLYSEAKVDQGDIDGHEWLLPLSLRANNIVSETKVRKGGGQVSKRSRRDILRLQDRNVGKYSFERLVL